MSSYCLITTHVDPQNAALPAPIAVMFFDDPELDWDQMLPVSCRITADRARALADELRWLADYAERLAREEQGATR